jgi:nucleoside phosphorylase
VHRELIGVEMEIYGLYAAANNSSNPRPKVFALKSVCDFADSEKDDKAHKYAAYTSARVLEALMERYAERLLA